MSNSFNDRTTIVDFLDRNDLSDVPDQRVAFANSRGGIDNITLILLRATSDGEGTNAEDIQRRIEILKSTLLCHMLSVSRLIRVLNITSLVECSAGQKLLSAGRPCDGLYVVLDGRLTVEDDPVLGRALLPGECVGESTLLRAGTVHASVVADEPSRLLLISRSQFGKLVRRLPKLGNALLRNLGDHLSQHLQDLRSDVKIEPGDTVPWKRSAD